MRFILIDRILSLTPGQTIVAERYLWPGEELYQDHFPGFPVVPGVLLTEMMAQTGGKCLDAEFRPRGRAMLAQIRSAHFREWVKPGGTVRIFAKVVANKEAYATARCHIVAEERRVCTADLMFAFVPADRFAADYRDPVLTAYLEAQGQSSGRSSAALAAGGYVPEVGAANLEEER